MHCIRIKTRKTYHVTGVVNAKGGLSGAFAFGGENEQARRLMADGIEVVDGKVDLKRFGMKIEKTD